MVEGFSIDLTFDSSTLAPSATQTVDEWMRFVNEKHEKLEKVSEVDQEAARECLSCLQATTF